MPTLTGLTERQRTRPHLLVQHGGRSLTVLERSFARADLEEIEYWDQQGVLDEALSGKASTKRDYTASLMGHLIENRRNGFLGYEPDRWDRILKKLWDGGAHRHTDRHARWIHGLAGHWLFDVMLDAGISPYAREYVPGRDNAPRKLIMDFGLHQHRQEGSDRYLFNVPGLDPDLVCQQIDRCIDFPAADEDALSNLLAVVVSRGVFMKDQDKWHTWRDRLLVRGANPLLGHACSIHALACCGPGKKAISRFDLRQINDAIDLGHPPSPAEIQFSLDERAKRDQEWTNASSQWMAALAPFIRKHATSEHTHSLEADTWTRLLDQPNGIDLCRRLLGAGLIAPWMEDPHQQKSRSWSTNMLASGHTRDPGALDKLMELFKDRMHEVDPSWASQSVHNYIRNNHANDSRLDSLVDDRIVHYGKNRKNPPWEGYKTHPLTHEELTHLLALSRWSPGHALPQGIFDILARRPILPGPEGIDADIRFMVDNGMLAQALAPRPPGTAGKEASDIHRPDWHSFTSFFAGWMQDEDVFGKVVSADPDLHWPMLALAVQIAARNQQEPGVRQKWFARMQSAFPETSALVLTKMFEDMANAPERWIEGHRETAAVDMLTFGASPSPEALSMLAEKTFCMAGKCNAVRQVELMTFLADVGLDIKTRGADLIKIALAEDPPSGPPTGLTEKYKPAIQALLDGGADVSRINFSVSAGPLHEFVRSTASSLALEAGTVSHVAGPRARRF